MTYGQIARMAGFPNHARYVGSTLKKLPKNTSLPWHRVVNGQGKISFPVDSSAYKKQKDLLEKEGALFIRGKLSLANNGWNLQGREIKKGFLNRKPFSFLRFRY